MDIRKIVKEDLHYTNVI